MAQEHVCGTWERLGEEVGQILGQGDVFDTIVTRGNTVTNVVLVNVDMFDLGVVLLVLSSGCWLKGWLGKTEGDPSHLSVHTSI